MTSILRQNNTLFILILLGLICFTTSQAQSLSERTEGITNFEKIRKITEDYYSNMIKSGAKKHPSDPKYKHWKRWEWYHKDRLDSKGNIQENQLGIIKINNEIKNIEKEESRSTNSDWTFVGPDGHIPSTTSTHYIGLGRVDRIAFHPTDPNIIFIGTPAGGLWKTTNGGTTWNPVDEYLPSLGISGIAISPTNPNLMYVLTGCGDGMGLASSSGVFKSTNGGDTWEKTGILSPINYSGYMLEMNPTNDQELFAATSKGLYRTTNGGTFWIKVIPESIKFYDVKFKPGTATTVYASTNFGMYYSDYSGSTGSWHLADLLPAPTETGRTAIAVTADDPNRVYLHMGPQLTNTTFQGFYYSSNSGHSFLRVATSPNIAGSQSGYDFCATASPVSKNIAIVGGLTCWRTTNSGSSWSEITTFGAGSSSPGYVHPDIHAVAYNPLNNYLYVGTDGGFYRSMDNGDNWTNLSEGIATTLFYHFSETPEDPNYLIGGTQDNGMKLRKSNSTKFDHVEAADGFSTIFYPGDKSKFYGSVNEFIRKYWNYGANFSSITPKEHWFCELATHQTNPSIVFAGTNEQGGRLYKSTNEGTTWDTLFLWAGDAVLTCPSNHNRVYFSGAKRIFLSNNLGASADSIHQNPGFPTEYGYITDLAVNPLNSSNVYATISGTTPGVKVMQSLNAGASWTNISNDLPNIPTNCIATTGSGDIYIGTDIGVFYKRASGSNWIPYRNGLPATIINDLAINESQNTIRAGSYGRGIWVSPLSNGSCETNLVWNTVTNMDGYHYYEASNSIVNKSILSGGMTTNIFMKSGNFIDLKEGFHAKSDGLYFKAYTGPCAAGGIPSLSSNEGATSKIKK